ncbi:MAG: L-serine ammonia-lyase, iron-sulfur-dependent subunit beta [Clostridia bacterium]|nr:L-serine ammonia-lyase, iron-sulfur-dependent subunit beta [Clostridia bacterium]
MGRGLFGILGPPMIGPSSSHTAGAARIGLMCRSIVQADIAEVTFFLHGSFANTYKGHGTDRALVGGLMGMQPDDERIIRSLDVAKKEKIKINFVKTDLGNVHPNTVEAVITSKNGETASIVASSIGGGEINLVSINGFHADLSGNYNAIIVRHKDKVGMISKITNMFEKNNINIVSLSNNREKKGQTAITIIEMDGELSPNMLTDISKTADIYSVSNINKI